MNSAQGLNFVAFFDIFRGINSFIGNGDSLSPMIERRNGVYVTGFLLIKGSTSNSGVWYILGVR